MFTTFLYFRCDNLSEVVIDDKMPEPGQSLEDEALDDDDDNIWQERRKSKICNNQKYEKLQEDYCDCDVIK